MLKKTVLILVLILAVLVTFYFLNNREKANPKEEPPISDKDPAQNNMDASTHSLVTEVIALAKEGKVLHLSYIAGQSSIQEIKNNWGNPQEIETAGTGEYANYPDHDASFGYRHELVYDVRSYHSDLQQIHLNDIKKVQGEPDGITYYKDDIYDQIILMYQLDEIYQLKWILPKPTDKEPNPAVHHISVLTSIQKQPPVTIDEMSLDEKIGQMIMAGIKGTEPNSQMNNLISQYKVGGIIFNGENLVSPKQTISYLNQIQMQNASNPLPIMFGVDQEGGRIYKLPGNLVKLPTNQEIGNIKDPSYSYQIGTLLGKQLKAFGFHMDFAPVLDVNSNPNNPVIGDRSFGSNPDIVSRLGIQTMKGIQSQNIISVVKHFPGHGDTSVDSHLELPVVNKTRQELDGMELVPFKHAILDGADVVMVGHITLPEIDDTYPSSMSDKVIQGILRRDLQFNGVVITDDLTMKAITNNYGIGQAAIQSVKAGSDLIMVAHDYNKIVAVFQALKVAVESGNISEERIDESVSRILELKKKYNVQNDTVMNVDIDELNQLTKEVLNK